MEYNRLGVRVGRDVGQTRAKRRDRAGRLVMLVMWLGRVAVRVDGEGGWDRGG